MASSNLSSFYPIYFLFIEIICGISIILMCEHFKRLLQHILLDIEEKELSTIIYFMELNALHIITIFTSGLYMNHKSKLEPYTTELSILLRLWCFLSFQCALTSFVIGFICIHTLHHVKGLMRIVFEDSYLQYYVDSNWKLIWDELQYHEQCCGVHTFLDWANVTYGTVEVRPVLLYLIEQAFDFSGITSFFLPQIETSHNAFPCALQLLSQKQLLQR